MKYTVGQVIFVVPKQGARVLPMQVIEEITKKTLKGEETTHLVQAGPRGPEANMLISEIDGEIFDTAEKARVVLIERATRSINKLVDSAVKSANEWYPNSFESSGTGILAGIKKTIVPSPSVNNERSSEVEELKAELQREAIEGSDIIELPDGTKARVRQVSVPEAMKS